MTDRVVNHSTFTLERAYPADVSAVFAAWADGETKRQWFAGGDTNGSYAMDFQVGGREIASGEHGGARMTFTTTYAEIRDAERIVYSSTMHSDDTLTTLSLTTVEFAAGEDGTTLTLTEHGAYLDGLEKPEWREEGTASQLDALAKVL